MRDTVSEQLQIFSNYLKNNGLKMTRQRELIVSTFLETEGHLCAAELFALVAPLKSNIGYATVFRTLKALVDCGLAAEIDLRDGRTRFEKVYRKPEHHHIVCEKCGRAIEFFSPELEAMESTIVSRYRVKPVWQRLQVFGVCDDCAEQRTTHRTFYDSDVVFARDALRIAIRAEQSCIRFYASASSASTRDSVRGVFSRILKEEKLQLENLQNEWEQLILDHPGLSDAPVFLHFDYEKLRDILPHQGRVEQLSQRNLNETDALRLALSLKTESYEFFQAYASQFRDSEGRDIFQSFADEEKEHCRLLRQELESATA